MKAPAGYRLLAPTDIIIADDVVYNTADDKWELAYGLIGSYAGDPWRAARRVKPMSSVVKKGKVLITPEQTYPIGEILRYQLRKLRLQMKGFFKLSL